MGTAGAHLVGSFPLLGSALYKGDFLFAEFSLSFYLSESFNLSSGGTSYNPAGICICESVIKQSAVLAVKYEPGSKPSQALGSVSIDCSRLGSILISVKIL